MKENGFFKKNFSNNNYTHLQWVIFSTNCNMAKPGRCHVTPTAHHLTPTRQCIDMELLLFFKNIYFNQEVFPILILLKNRHFSIGWEGGCQCSPGGCYVTHGGCQVTPTYHSVTLFQGLPYRIVLSTF